MIDEKDIDPVIIVQDSNEAKKYETLKEKLRYKLR